MDTISETDQRLVALARAGDMDSLDALARRHQSWAFNLALRMVWRRDVAEDATQEILIKAVTKSSTFASHSAFRTWLYRIAVNHLLNVRKSEMEEKKMTFADMGASLDGVADEDLQDERALPVETKLVVAEAKPGCITAMLMCLDRRRSWRSSWVRCWARPARPARRRWTSARTISGSCCRRRGMICINS